MVERNIWMESLTGIQKIINVFVSSLPDYKPVNIEELRIK